MELLSFSLSFLAAAATDHGGGSSPCRQTADLAYESCRKGALADYLLRRGTCVNVPDPGERTDCFHEALQDFHDAKDACAEQRAARRDACERLGGGRYHPEIDPRDFVAQIDHPWTPLLPGTVLTYERTGGDLRGRIERTVVTVLDVPEVILGVTCTTVHDVVSVGDELVEDTLDWFAQDADGNLWYFGELSLAYEDGRPASLDGSWRAGVDGAEPGIVMEASPRAGDFYRQEFLLGEAEDLALVLSLDDAVTVPAGSFPHCLLTEESTPLEPGAVEHKDYALGVGLVLTLEDDGTRTELVEIRR